MILTFYKPRTVPRVGSVRESRTTVFLEMLDAVLGGEVTARELTSQYLFNKLILHAWKAHSLGELRVSRREFAEALHRRGWEYDHARHLWRRGGRTDELPLDLN
jgi:hypothetical protein